MQIMNAAARNLHSAEAIKQLYHHSLVMASASVVHLSQALMSEVYVDHPWHLHPGETTHAKQELNQRIADLKKARVQVLMELQDAQVNVWFAQRLVLTL